MTCLICGAARHFEAEAWPRPSETAFKATHTMDHKIHAGASEVPLFHYEWDCKAWWDHMSERLEERREVM